METMPFAATRMNVEIIIVFEVRERGVPSDITYPYYDKWNPNYDINDLFTKQKQTHRHREQICSYQRGKEVGKLGVWN